MKIEIAYNIGTFAIGSYNIGEVVVVKDLSCSDVTMTVKTEAELKEVPEVINALAKLAVSNWTAKLAKEEKDKQESETNKYSGRK